MKYLYRIVTHRSTPKTKGNTIVAEGAFDSPSDISAKSKVTQIANSITLFQYTQSWDGEEREYTGKDIRWKSWEDSQQIENKEGEPFIVYRKMSTDEYGEQVYGEGIPKYGSPACYNVYLYLYYE